MKAWVLTIVAVAIGVITIHEPTRNKIIASLPDKVTSAFNSEPADALPKDLVLSLTDDHDLGFVLKSMDGQQFGPEELKGKVVIALVWNTDCGAQCLDTMRHIQRL